MTCKRLVFFGTPDFAASALRALIDQDEEIVAVVTQPDRPKGRNRKLAAPPVKVLAESHGIPVVQPESVKGPEFMEWLREQRVELAVVAAYGKIIPQSILELPEYGFINIHASLLPKHRGASPIQRAVMDGDVESGVTIMQMDVGLDTGDMLLKRKVPIEPQTTAAMLHDDLAAVGGEALTEFLCMLRTGQVNPEPQDDALSTYAPLMSKKDGEVDWSRSAEDVYNLVRGVFPWPGAYTFHEGRRIRLYPFEGWSEESVVDSAPGSIVGADGEGIRVACGTGFVSLGGVQLEGRRAVDPVQFLQGYELDLGAQFGGEL